MYYIVLLYIAQVNSFQMSDDTNPLSELMQCRKVTQVDQRGLDAVKRIRGMRLIHPTHYGRICPIETGEGMSAGIAILYYPILSYTILCQIIIY